MKAVDNAFLSEELFVKSLLDVEAILSSHGTY